MLKNSDLHVVTGAFGFTGRHIARLLLAADRRVATLTAHPGRADPFCGRVRVLPLRFDDPDNLAAQLRGAAALYNTYWIRFPRGATTFDLAVGNTRALIDAARRAGVPRFVHISITNPDPHSPLPYFRGKALAEQTLVGSGLSYAILRPTLMFGEGDVLINNIAWLLRRLPIFGVFGDGAYRVQPVHVGDVAALAVAQGTVLDNTIIDAVGPETYQYADLVRLIGRHVGGRARIAAVSPRLGLAAARLLGWIVRDVIITEAEVAGLMAELLISSGPHTCPRRFSEWLAEHSDALGQRWASELQRHYR